jgi:hypothetical protein
MQVLRSLKAENSRTRFDYIRSRAEAVNEERAAKREELASKLQVIHCQDQQVSKAHQASLTPQLYGQVQVALQKSPACLVCWSMPIDGNWWLCACQLQG